MVRSGRGKRLADALRWPASHLLEQPHLKRQSNNASKVTRPWALGKADETLLAQLLVDMLSVLLNKTYSFDLVTVAL